MNKFRFFKKSIISVFIILVVSILQVSASEATTTLSVTPDVTNNEVIVSIKYTSSIMCGGSFNFIYDTKDLRLTSVEEGDAIKETSHFINSEFADDTIRVNWVSTTEMPTEGILINIKFEILSETFSKSDIDIEGLKIADGNGDKQEAEYIIDYDSDEQINSPGEDEEDNSDVVAPEDNNDINHDSGNSYLPGRKPTSKDSVVNTETEIDNFEVGSEFIDVKDTDWFFESVKYVVDNNLMKGVSDTEFAPDKTLTRAMLVTVLFRNEMEPTVNNNILFSDVDADSWYFDAVSWAKHNGIVNGINDNEFAPDNSITREQIAAIMFRYAQYKGMDIEIREENLNFEDADEISDYAVLGAKWAVDTGLMKGKTSTTINPKDNATRAEISAILKRFVENNK